MILLYSTTTVKYNYELKPIEHNDLKNKNLQADLLQ